MNLLNYLGLEKLLTHQPRYLRISALNQRRTCSVTFESERTEKLSIAASSNARGNDCCELMLSLNSASGIVAERSPRRSFIVKGVPVQGSRSATYEV